MHTPPLFSFSHPCAGFVIFFWTLPTIWMLGTGHLIPWKKEEVIIMLFAHITYCKHSWELGNPNSEPCLGNGLIWTSEYSYICAHLVTCNVLFFNHSCSLLLDVSWFYWTLINILDHGVRMLVHWGKSISTLLLQCNIKRHDAAIN